MEASPLKLAFFENDLDYLDEPASCKEDSPVLQLFLSDCVDGPASCKEDFRYYNPFLAHRTNLVGSVRTTEEG